MKYLRLFMSIGLLLGVACVSDGVKAGKRAPVPSPGIRLPDLPMAVANNAVAVLQLGERRLLFSFLGLGAGKTWRDVRGDAWVLALEPVTAGDDGVVREAPAWQRLPDVPGPGGRLAATAVAVAGSVYLFGGYTVAEDGSERSVPLVHRYDPDTGRYQERAPMPVPVDDTVSLVYQDRFVYLVSGWHDTENVALVQLYDTVNNSWQQATSFPGPPVFGHAGGISGRDIVICDGVKVVSVPTGQRQFRPSPECYRGSIDPARPDRIAWRAIQHHPGEALYRMAATGASDGRVIFAGGSDNPYNFNGVGYDGRPSSPSDSVFAYDFRTSSWQALPKLAEPSMDHRGLLEVGDGYVLVGGMGEEQRVLRRVQTHYPD